jgi:hypothetical protein
MYLWRVDQLAARFRAGTLSEREQLSYVLVTVGVAVTGDRYFVTWGEPVSYNEYDVATLLGSLLVILGGTVYCYVVAERSGGAAGFVSRYFCLGIPVFVRLAAYFLAVLAVLFPIALVMPDSAFDAIVGEPEPESSGLETPIIVLVLEVLYYWLLARAIRSSYA